MKNSSDDEDIIPGKKKRIATASVFGTKYNLVTQSIEEFGLQCLHKEEAAKTAYLVWTDSMAQTESLQELKNYQRINHFPGMAAICRKDLLAKNMSKIAQSRPEEFDFVPETWVMPAEYHLLLNHYKERKRKGKRSTFIAKPQNGAMGNGIHLFQNPTQLPPNENLIVQEYLDQPYVLDGYKIDLRIYVLVTHCDPLKAFIYRDGLVRLGTEKYTSPSHDNMSSSFMHLTNYSVNKRNKNFERHHGADRGSKRSILSLMKSLKSAGCNTGLLWRQITNVVMKTLIVASPFLLHNYRTSRPGQQPNSDSVCFEILGFDILLDRKLKPWLLEVNRSPSFTADENVDMEIKSGVLMDALNLINIKPGDKVRHMAKQKADSQRRLFKQRNEAKGPEAQTREVLLSKRKGVLEEKLFWAKLHGSREEHENQHMNNYTRLFPSYETHLQNKYLDLLRESFRVFLPNASKTHQKHVLDLHRYQSESDVISMIDELDVELKAKKKVKKLKESSSPTPSPPRSALSHKVPQRPSSSAAFRLKIPTTIQEDKYSPLQFYGDSRPSTADGKFQDSSDSADVKSLHPLTLNENVSDIDRETLRLLENLRLRFPGKTSSETASILQYMTENWTVHKSQLASYWLVKLDSSKREKVIDIVRHNVNRIIHCKQLASDPKYQKTTSLINRVLNLMLSCHGHGLWSCFTTPRVAQLCKDCLLIVYQFTHGVELQPVKLRASFSCDGLDAYGRKSTFSPRQTEFSRRQSDGPPTVIGYSKKYREWRGKNYRW